MPRRCEVELGEERLVIPCIEYWDAFSVIHAVWPDLPEYATTIMRVEWDHANAPAMPGSEPLMPASRRALRFAPIPMDVGELTLTVRSYPATQGWMEEVTHLEL